MPAPFGSEKRKERRKPSKKRMLIIVNPYATTVSDRLRNLVVYALQGRYDVVAASGGDGTLNEVANGLAGTDMPMATLPGGSANVVARSLGIPNDVVDATEHLLSLADKWEPRKIDLGRADDRRFVFACGVGIDATVVKRVDAHPKLKAHLGPWFYSWCAVSAFYRRYLVNPVRLRVKVGDQPPVEGVTAITQNSDPFTYFSTKPVYVNEGIAIDNGTLSMAVLKRAAQRDMPTLLPRLFNQRKPAVRHRQIIGYEGVTLATIESISEDRSGAPRSFQLQVDGDYIGERTLVSLGIDPGALTIIA